MKIDLPVSFSKKYRIIEEIGVGGMGAVFRAHHLELDRPAAVKFLTGSIIASEASLKRFAAEGKTCSLLHHPNIVQIYDLDMACKSPYIVFELVEGSDLKVMTKKRTIISMGELIELLAQICDGLHYAHKQRVIHRDVKPSNIIVTPSGQAKIADFGIAKQGDIKTVKTRTGVILGTPRYMSPEQSRGDRLTPATDIYSMGVVTFEAFAGVRPFEAPSELETILKHIHEDPPLASSINPSLPKQLVEVINQCLAKKPDQRPSSAKELADLLRACVSSSSKTKDDLITLGCRTGLLESGFDESLVKSKADGNASRKAIPKKAIKKKQQKTKLSMSSAGSEGLSLPRAKEKVPQQKSKKPWFFLGAAVFIALLSLFSSLGKSAPGQIAKLRVRAVGQQGVLVEYLASWETEEPTIIICPKGVQKRVDYSLARKMRKTVVGEGELKYRYSLAVTGLKRNLAYTVAVSKPDGTSSLPLSFSTKRGPVSHEVVPEVALDKNGNMTIELNSSVPFLLSELKGVTLENKTEDSVITSFSKLPFKIEKPAVIANKEIFVKTQSLDGPKTELSISVRDLLVERAREVFDGFMKDYRAGDIYKTFRGKSGRSAEYFRDYGAELVKIKKRDERPTKKWSEAMWRRLDQRLLGSHNWYERARQLAPGISVLCNQSNSLDLSWKLDLANIPLRSIQGAAFYQKLPGHPGWGEDVLPNKQVIARVERPFIEKPRYRKVFSEVGLTSHEQYSMMAAGHPQAAGSVISVEAEKAMDTHVRVLNLFNVDLDSYSQAEIEIFVNDANVHRQFLLDINDGAFLSAIQTAKEDFIEQAKTSGGESSYMKLGMMIFSGLGSEKMSAEKMIRDLAKIAPAIDDPRITYRRKYYQRLPISTLRKGRNRIMITVINSPTSYIALSYLISIKLRLR